MLRWVAMVALCGVAACGEDAANRERGSATLQLVSVDTIPDPGGRMLGRFSRLLIGRDSTMYLPIHYANHVLHLDRDGRLLRRIGRNGSGPGEFSTSPIDLVEWGDTLVFVSLGTRQVSLFRRSDGQYLARHTLDGFPATLAAGPGKLFVGALSPMNGTLAGVMATGDTAMRPIVPIPAVLHATPIAMRKWPVSLLTVANDTVMVGTMASDWLLVATAEGAVVDSFRIPAARRRPIPADVDKQLEPRVQSRLAHFLFATLTSLETRTDGLQLAVHQDWFTTDTTDRPFVDGERITETLRAYATLIDRANRRACVDAAIPVDWASLPAAISIDRNDIVVLGQVDDGSESPAVELRRYRVDLSTCAWMPLDAPAG